MRSDFRLAIRDLVWVKRRHRPMPSPLCTVGLGDVPRHKMSKNQCFARVDRLLRDNALRMDQIRVQHHDQCKKQPERRLATL